MRATSRPVRGSSSPASRSSTSTSTSGSTPWLTKVDLASQEQGGAEGKADEDGPEQVPVLHRLHVHAGPRVHDGNQLLLDVTHVDSQLCGVPCWTQVRRHVKSECGRSTGKRDGTHACPSGPRRLTLQQGRLVLHVVRVVPVHGGSTAVASAVAAADSLGARGVPSRLRPVPHASRHVARVRRRSLPFRRCGRVEHVRMLRHRPCASAAVGGSAAHSAFVRFIPEPVEPRVTERLRIARRGARFGISWCRYKRGCAWP